eukprot:1337594-Rhodomonas_salina.1
MLSWTDRVRSEVAQSRKDFSHGASRADQHSARVPNPEKHTTRSRSNGRESGCAQAVGQQEDGVRRKKMVAKKAKAGARDKERRRKGWGVGKSTER